MARETEGESTKTRKEEVDEKARWRQNRRRGAVLVRSEVQLLSSTVPNIGAVLRRPSAYTADENFADQ